MLENREEGGNSETEKETRQCGSLRGMLLLLLWGDNIFITVFHLFFFSKITILVYIDFLVPEDWGTGSEEGVGVDS